jgi:hypothetical protein
LPRPVQVFPEAGSRYFATPTFFAAATLRLRLPLLTTSAPPPVGADEIRNGARLGTPN